MSGRGNGATVSVIKAIEIQAAMTPGSVSLAQGIPSFDTPEFIKRRVREALDGGFVARYSLTPGMIELREAIAESLEHQGMAYDSRREIIVTVGSIEAITATLLATCGDGDEVIIATPSYVSYTQAVRLTGATPVFAPLSEESGWGVDVPAFLTLLNDRTKAIILCNPNNPTGTIFSKADLIAIADAAKRQNIVIILDEVYRDFLYDEDARRNYWSLASDPSYRDVVVRVFSFSKAFAMTGWRVGYLHTNRELAERILSVHDNLVTCAPVISQFAALAALEMKPSDWEPYLSEYRARRELVMKSLADMSPWLDFVKPSSSYFTFPRLKKENLKHYETSEELTKHLLQHEKVALVPGSAFGPSGEDHLRISFSRSRGDIIEGMKRLHRHFESHA